MTENNLPVRVLIVDDNPAKLLALSAALEGMDIDIVTATSGMEALHQLLEQEFAIVLLDVNMPVMDGFETATMIRSRPRSENLPILFITSEALSDDSRLQGYALGAVDYVLSPVLPLILRAKVATFADLHRLREQSTRYGNEMLKKNEEIARQNRELTEAQSQLGRMNDSLEARVQERTAALRESEILLGESQRIAKLGSYVLDITTGLWKSSAMLDQLFGIDASYEHSIARWGDLIHPDDRAMMMAYFTDEVLGQEKSFDREYRIIRRNDQAERWVHGIGELKFDAQGKPVNMHGVIGDITERRRLALDAQQKADQVLQLFESNADGLIVIDRDGQICAANPAAAQLFGRTVEVLLGVPFGSPVVAGETSEITIQPRTGSAKDVEMRIAEIIWDGRPASLASLRDVTERKAAETKIRKLSMAVEQSPESILVTDLDGNIEYVNEAFVRVKKRLEPLS